MKKNFVYALAMIVLGGLATFQSCTEEEAAAPITTVTSATEGYNGATNTFEGEVGDTLSLDISVEAEAFFNTMRITDDAGNTLIEAVKSSDGQTSFDSTYNYVLDAANAGDTVVLTIAGIDDDANSDEVDVTVIVAEAAVEVVSYEATLLYVPLADDSSTETFFSTDDGDTYSRDDVENTAESVSPRVDFGYYYGANNMASLASPEEYPELFADLSAWGTRNATTIEVTEMPESHFTEIMTNADLENHYGMTDMSEADGTVTNLEVGDVIAFETDANKENGPKKGFILVKAISGTFNSGDYIEIEVKIMGDE